MIDPNNKTISIGRQCELVGLSRAGYYFAPGMKAWKTTQSCD